MNWRTHLNHRSPIKRWFLGATTVDLDQGLVDDLVLRKQRQGSKALKGVDNRVAQLARLNVTNGGGDVLVAGLADAGKRVYITGSNAKMLSGEVATTLGGVTSTCM